MTYRGSGVTINTDNFSKIGASVKTLTGKVVLVGIPDDGEARPDDEITNSALGYIHEFGAPEANIPARPFLIPGIEGIKDTVVARLKKAGTLALNGETASKVEEEMNKLGLVAVSAVKSKIMDGPFAPLAEATKRARLSRTAAYKKASASSKQKMMATFLGGDFTPLVDTGKMRDAVTYIVAKKGR